MTREAHFCTLFDSYYLARGLALYESLVETGEPFHIYIFPFDDGCAEALRGMGLDHATIIPMGDFEDDDLKTVKEDRSRVEYMWTCTPSIIAHAMDRFSLPVCTYLDADLFFFSPPGPLLEELSDGSILLTEHRYTPRYDQAVKAGRFCVQFISFRNDLPGRKALDWWRRACLDWCYARHEDGKFGDQKYLDDWETRFAGVRVLGHLGGGVAPWNVQQYEIYRSKDVLKGRETLTGEVFDVVFYHFHDLRFVEGDLVDLGSYRLTPPVRELLYRPYLEKLTLMEGRAEVKIPLDGRAKVRTRGWYALYNRLRKKMMSNVVRRSDLAG